MQEKLGSPDGERCLPAGRTQGETGHDSLELCFRTSEQRKEGGKVGELVGAVEVILNHIRPAILGRT